MSTFITLLRGVNVGGKNILPMKELKEALEESGFGDVKTYIQSGNIVLSSDENPEEKVSALIQGQFSVAPDLLVLSEKEFRTAVENNPFKKMDGKTVHFFFCKTKPTLNSSKLEELKHESEEYEGIGKVFYLHAPDGIGRSKLVSNLEKCLSAVATGRNLNTINKVTEMVKNT